MRLFFNARGHAPSPGMFNIAYDDDKPRFSPLAYALRALQLAPWKAAFRPRAVFRLQPS